MMAAETLLLRISLRCSSLLMILLVSQYFFQISFANRNSCAPSSCGIFRNISYPFRLKDDPSHCGGGRAELACENNVTSVYLNSHKYYVKAINYGTDDNSIRVVDASINNDDTCSFPNSSASYYNFSYHYLSINYLEIRSYNGVSLSQPITLMSCPTPLKNSSMFTDITHDCASNNSLSLSRFTYIKVGSMNASEVPQTCGIDLMVMTSWNKFMDSNSNSNVSLSEIHDALLYGFELTFCRWCSSPGILRDYFLPRIIWILMCTVGLSCALVSPPVMTIIGFTAVLGLLYLAVRLIFSEITANIDHPVAIVPLLVIGLLCALVSPPVMTIIGFAAVSGLLYLAVGLIFSEAIEKDPAVTTTVTLQIIGALLIYVVFTHL